MQPTADELLAFLADRSARQAHARSIDALFRRPEFVDRWSLKWGDLLQNCRKQPERAGDLCFRASGLRGAVAANMPLDEFARHLLTSRGGTADDPATGLPGRSVKTPMTPCSERRRCFCGVRMLCARCHAHPFENWTQADYYGLHSFFNQLGAKADPRSAERAERHARWSSTRPPGYSVNPRSRKLQPPRFLGGTEPELACQHRSTDRLRQMADVAGESVTSPAAWRIGSGATSSIAASSTRSMTCAPPTRRSTPPARRLDQGLRRPQVRRAPPDAHHRHLAHLPAQQHRQRHQCA